MSTFATMSQRPVASTNSQRIGPAGLSVLSACTLALVLALAGCGALPDKPGRTTLYDFGPGALSASVPSASGAPRLPAIALADIEANARIDGTQLLYRLGYADANELRPYAQSRWSLAPAQLLRQRLRDALATRRTVLDPQESATIARSEVRPQTLRISLEEFTQYFESPASSAGLVRLRATLTQGTPGGDRVLGQRTFTVRLPAPSADAPGGVKALAAASDAIVAELVAWVDEAR
jgi:cholesterol transport system auxiliary component